MATSVNIKQLIENSAVLSEAERKEWLDLLPFMNDKQQSELLLILQPNGLQQQATSTVSTPAPPAPSSPAAVVPPPVLPPLPTLNPVSSTVSGPVIAPAPPAATTVSAFLNKNFSSELHRGSIPGTFKPEAVGSVPVQAEKVSPPVQIPHKPEPVSQGFAPISQPAAPFMPPFGAVPEQKVVGQSSPLVSAIGPKSGGLPVSAAGSSLEKDLPPEPQEPVISALSLEAVRMLNVATLRAKGVMSIETELKALCGKFGYFSVQFAFEQSPLYQAYVAVGARILKDHQTFEEVQAALASAGRPYLTKPEFEEFSDLLRRLKGHA